MLYLLLTEATSSIPKVFSTIICVVILLLAIYWLYTRYKKLPDGDEKLKELLESMKSIVIANIIESLNNLKIDDKSLPLAEIESKFLESIKDDIWNLIDNEIEKYRTIDTLIYSAIRNAVTQEKIEEYIYTIFAEDTIQDKIIDIYNTAIKERAKEMVEEDESLSEEMDAYENDEVEADPVEELDPAVDINAPVEDQQIIPPVDEESDTVSIDDGSIEILEEIPDDTTERIIADTESLEED